MLNGMEIEGLILKLSGKNCGILLGIFCGNPEWAYLMQIHHSKPETSRLKFQTTEKN